VSLTADDVKLVAHPVRRQILSMLTKRRRQRGEGSSLPVHSAKEMAAEFNMTIPQVSYHVGILRDAGLISVVRETPRRGAIERHYGVDEEADAKLLLKVTKMLEGGR
jgi:DNA-binding transcriptional ArsR family regulator